MDNLSPETNEDNKTQVEATANFELETQISELYARVQDFLPIRPVNTQRSPYFVVDFLPIAVCGAKEAEVSTNTPPVSNIIEKVTAYFETPKEKLISARRTQSLVEQRQITMRLLQKVCGQSLSEIGRILGNRDHSTVIHGLNVMEKRLADPEDKIKSTYEQLLMTCRYVFRTEAVAVLDGRLQVLPRIELPREYVEMLGLNTDWAYDRSDSRDLEPDEYSERGQIAVRVLRSILAKQSTSRIGQAAIEL